MDCSQPVVSTQATGLMVPIMNGGSLQFAELYLTSNMQAAGLDDSFTSTVICTSTMFASVAPCVSLPVITDSHTDNYTVSRGRCRSCSVRKNWCRQRSLCSHADPHITYTHPH